MIAVCRISCGKESYVLSCTAIHDGRGYSPKTNNCSIGNASNLNQDIIGPTLYIDF